MARSLRLQAGPEEGLRRVLQVLLESHRVEGTFTLARMEGGKMAYALITDPCRIEDSAPLHPIMPTNLGQILDRFTMKGAPPKPLAVVARPCELRAFVEMVKRRKGHAENLYFISCTCPGVFPLSASIEGELDRLVPEYWQGVAKGEVHPELRPACRSCVELRPFTADLTLRVAEGDGGFELVADGPRGESLLSGLLGPLEEGALDLARLARLQEGRSGIRAVLFDEAAGRKGMAGLVDTFGKCIGCHACGKACPICSCNLCTFESTLFERSPADIDRELMSKRGVRLPPDTVFFHLGRMVHMATSCVACGSCQDVCPVGIPVAIAFKRVGESLQRTFGYVPGRDMAEPLPVTTFEEKEFMGIEGKGGDEHG